MALFKTIAEIKTYLGAIQKNLDIASIMPYVEEAELFYLEDVLGNALYASLEAAYQADTLTPEQTALLKKIQRPLAHLTFYQYAQNGNVFISDLGFQQTATDNTMPASQWAVEKVMHYTRTMADDFLERLIKFLIANQADYPDWTQSEVFIEKTFLLNSAEEIQKRYPIENSYLGYKYLRPYIQLSEKKHITANISLAQLNRLKETGLTAIETQALELAKDALAFWSVYEALPNIGIEVSLQKVRATVFQEARSIKKIDLDILKEMKAQVKNSAQASLDELMKLLNDNPDEFIPFRDSGKYIEPPSQKSYDLPDNSDSTIFLIK